MYVYHVRWVKRGEGPRSYNEHENEWYSTDLHGEAFVTCSSAKLAYQLVKAAHPDAVVERPKLLGLA